MKYFFKKVLSQEELIKIKLFYDSLDEVCIEQNPFWYKLVNEKEITTYFWSEENDKIIVFALINEKSHLFINVAHIQFGPIFRKSDADSLELALISIYNYYKQLRFCLLTIQLGFQTGAISDYIEYKINKLITIKYIFDKNNWSSISINLLQTYEEIQKSFSKGHKSSIRKALKDGISVREITSDKDLSEFYRIYKKMEEYRNIPSNSNLTLFKNVSNYFRENDKGIGLIVVDKNSTILGGALIIFQGVTARYYKGASDPDRKDIPILHLAISEAIKISKEKGFKYFDLWGYNHFVGEEDAIFYINRFKKGFSNNYIFYPKKMYFILNRLTYSIYIFLKGIKAISKKLPM